ncbi:MAG: 6-phosphofructokinase [Chloroflexi bacterium]|nr:6-phosphofructokinase [Chloroflexota bacterium]MBU1747203.1 6-phosphofructokinase [Chloroflexota bacterium]MBU1878697.1 6-phosphofructokinase [Chloroflexota bacterium]
MKIGVLTGGGDAPGLNSAIRGVVRRALQGGDEVLGIQEGWLGMLEGIAEPLTHDSVSDIVNLGGTILGTSRTNPYKHEGGVIRCRAKFEAWELDALIAIGGDDTLGVAARLADEEGLPCVGIPKTMDNDITGTDYTIGFDTAVTIVMDSLDKLTTTVMAHRRVMVVEVMGRDAGWVALVGGMAGGADFILIPEVPVDMKRLCDHLLRRWALGKRYSLVVVSEGVRMQTDVDEAALEKDEFGHILLKDRGVGPQVAEQIEHRTGLETRVMVLGHLVRGGSPSLNDRINAGRLGVTAVDYVREGRWGYMPAIQGGQVVAVRLADAVGQTKTVDLDLYHLAEVFF